MSLCTPETQFSQLEEPRLRSASVEFGEKYRSLTNNNDIGRSERKKTQMSKYAGSTITATRTSMISFLQNESESNAELPSSETA